MINAKASLGLRIVLAVVVLSLPMAPQVLPLSGIQLLTEFLTALTLAMAWNMLAGYANLMTVGQHALVGAGAYAFYSASVLGGLPVYVAVVLAGAVSLALATLMLGFVFRLRHAYFAIGTWVAAQVCILVVAKLPGLGGGAGVSVPVAVMQQIGARAQERFTNSFFMSLLLAALLLSISFLLLRSKLGLALTAVRDNEEAAGSIGISVARIRILSFLFVAPFLGVAGALIALQKVRLTPEATFSLVDWTGVAMFIAVIGGIGTLEGPIIGAVIYFLIRHYLADQGSWYLIVLGLAAISVMIIEPGGVWGVVRRRFGVEIFPVTQRLSPSMDERPESDDRVIVSGPGVKSAN